MASDLAGETAPRSRQLQMIEAPAVPKVPASEDAPLTEGPDKGLVPLQSILCTEELYRRPSRPPDHEAENSALKSLVRALANSPGTILQTLADTILKVFKADSAGLSLLTKEGNRFYWPAIAGGWQPHLGGGTPREFGPCGDVLDCNAPLLFKHWERRYLYLVSATPPANEGLLVPFYVKGKAVGTIWAIAHSDQRKFDSEDLRQLESLALFASSAYQAVAAQEALEGSHRELVLGVAQRDKAEASRDLAETFIEQLQDEIQQRQLAEQQGRESESRFRALFNGVPVAIYSTDAAGTVQEFNSVAVELWGREPQRGDPHERYCASYRLHLPDGSDLPHNQTPVVAVLTGQVPVVRDAEVVIERPDGSRVTVNTNIVPLKNDAGEITGVMNCFYDITERKRAEERLHQNNNTFFNLIQNAPFGLYVVDAQFRLIQVSTASQRVFANVHPLIGRDFEEVIRTIWNDPFASEVLARFRHTLASGEPFAAPNTIQKRSDNLAVESYDWRIERITLPNGEFGVVCYFYDVSERNLAAEALRQSEERFRTLFNLSSVAVYSIDTSGVIQNFNLRAAELWGQSPAVGDTDQLFCGSYKLYRPDGTFIPHDRCPMATVVSGEIAEARDAEVLIERPDRSRISVIVNIRPLKNDHGEITGAINCFYDITERKKAEKHTEMLVTLSRDLANATEEADIVKIAVDTVGRHLNGHRCYFIESLENQNRLIVSRNYVRDDAPSIAGELSLFDFGGLDWWHQFASGDFFVEDVSTDPLTRAKSASYAEVGVPSYAVQPYRRDGDWTVCLVVTERSPRKWTAYDLRVLEDVVARVWPMVERARANLEVRESEERYRGLFTSIDEGFCIIELIWDAQERPVDYRFLEVNPSFEKHTGIHNATGRWMRRDLVPEIENYWIEIYGKVAKRGEAVRFINEARAMGARWFDVYAFRTGGSGSSKVAVLFNDITERRQAEAALRESEERYRNLFVSMDEGFCLLKIVYDQNKEPVDYLCLEANPSFEKQTGIAEPVGKSARESAPDHEPEAIGIYHNVIQTGEPVRFINHASALNRWFDIHAFRVGGAADCKVAVIFTNISERKRQEDALRQSEERYRNLFDSIDEGFCVIDVLFDPQGEAVDYRFLEVNPTFEKQIGLSKVEGKLVRELLPDIEEFWIQIYGKIALTGEPLRFTNEVKTLHKWLDVYACRVGGPESRKVAVVFNDITARREAEAAMGHQAALLLTISDNAAQLLSADSPLTLLDAIFGRLARVLGVEYYFNYLLRPDGQALILESSGGLSDDERASFAEWTLTSGESAAGAEGSNSPVHEMGAICAAQAAAVGRIVGAGPVVFHPLQMGGRTLGTFGVASSVRGPFLEDEVRFIRTLCDLVATSVERARLIHDVSLARDISEQANASKDMFLASLSHELRTPLSPVLLLAGEAINDPATSCASREIFATIVKNVKLEARLIDDLLDVTRITYGKLALDLQSVDLHAVLLDAVETVKAEFQEKQIVLKMDLAAGRPFLRGDPVRLQQIFWNVLRNAGKFSTPGGEITVKSRIVANGPLSITIVDHGLGMTKAELARLFTSFSQGDHGSGGGSHRFGGLGLGLSISRMLVELQGGSIRAQSAGPNQGATFIVEFPLHHEARTESPVQTSTISARGPARTALPRMPVRILLVEDHEATRTAMTRLLVRRHYDVVPVGSLAEARAAAASQTFDLLISDLGLPDGSGNELMAELHARFGLKGIALTGYGREEDVSRSGASGFVAHLTKPVSIELLENTLANIAPAQATEARAGIE